MEQKEKLIKFMNFTKGEIYFLKKHLHWDIRKKTLLEIYSLAGLYQHKEEIWNFSVKHKSKPAFLIYARLLQLEVVPLCIGDECDDLKLVTGIKFYCG